MARILDFNDGFTSSEEPVKGSISPANKLTECATDADFVIYKGSAATASDIYYNTTTDEIRLYNGTDWVSLPALTPTGDLVLSGNTTVQGDLVVNGTTTTINAENLEVTDRNITVNKDGIDASAEGAGLTVDRDSTNGSLVFDSTKTSKWKAGLQGSEVELADVSSSQVITNKTINAPDNSITNISNSNISTSAGIDVSKLETLTPEKLVVTNPSGQITTLWGVSAIQASYLSGATGNIQTQIDSKVDVSHESDTSVHGVTGDVVGTTDTQILTNKDLDGGTASNSNRITLPKNTNTNLQALTRKEGTIVYDTTTKKSYLDNGTSLSPIGSGSGNINFISNPDGSIGTTGWTEGVYTAATRPSGSFTAYSSGSFAVTTTSTNPLGTGTSSILLSKASGSSKQGCAIETSFVLPLSYRAKVLQIEVDYIVMSGTFVAGSNTADSSLIWYCAFSTDNGSTYTVSEPSSFKCLSNSTTNSDKFRASIQTPSNATNMKLIAYVAETANSAWQVKAIASVSPSNYVYGTPITDWINAGSITLSATTTAPTKGTVDVDTVEWRRVGGDYEVRYTYRQTAAGSAGSGDYLFALPIGLQFSSSIPSYTTAAALHTQTLATKSNISIQGSTNDNTNGGPSYIAAKYSSNQFRVSTQNGFSSIGNISSSYFDLSVTARAYSFTVRFKGEGISASVQMSDQTDSRVVDFAAHHAGSGVAYSVGTVIPLDTLMHDTHGGWDSTNKRYYIPVSGYYNLSLNMYGANSVQPGYAIHVNGTVDKIAWGSGSVGGPANITYDKFLKVGDYVDVRANGSSSQQPGGGTVYGNVFSVKRISGPSAIAATETISARYSGTTGTIPTGTAANYVYTTKDHDTHGIYNTTTGVITIPAAGKYEINTTLEYQLYSTINSGIYITLYKNNSLFSRLDIKTAQVANTNIEVILQGNDLLACVAGDILELRIQKDTNTSSNAINTSTSFNKFSIKRIGN